MNKYEERERGEGFIRARFTLFAEGGRRSAVFEDYRCDWDIGNVEEDGNPTINGGPLTLEGKDELRPGEQSIVRIHPIAPQFWTHVTPGMAIRAHEGARVVGSAEVLEVIPPTADTPK